MINIKHQQGSSLIEVLVALFILAVGLLGVLAMQSRAVQLNQNAYLYSQAAVLANDLMEAMRTTPAPPLAPVAPAVTPAPIPTPAPTPSYVRGFDAAVPTQTCGTSSGGCTSREQIIEWNLAQWLNNIEGSLPGGQGAVEMTGSNVNGLTIVTIKVRFHIGYDESNNSPIEDTVIIVNGIEL